MRDQPRRRYVRENPAGTKSPKAAHAADSQKRFVSDGNAGELPKIILKIPAKTEIDVPMQPTEHVTRVSHVRCLTAEVRP